MSAPLIGVLALQGAFVAHQQRLAELAVPSRQVRTPADLDGIDALVMPGGESTTMSKLLTSSGLFDDLKARMSDGLAVFGTCAGMILLATDVIDGRPDQRSFGMIDLVVRRNGYGRQVESFEADLTVDGLGPTRHRSTACSSALRWSSRRAPPSKCSPSTRASLCSLRQGALRWRRSTPNSPPTTGCTPSSSSRSVN